MMQYINCTIKGKHFETKRVRTLKLTGPSVEWCKEEAVNQGLLDSLDVVEEYFRMPSENQISYAKDLGISFTDKTTFLEIGDMIGRIADDDPKHPNPQLMNFANNRQFEFSEYVGKKKLYNIIFNSLDGVDKVAFFILSVYRWLSEDRYADLDTHPRKEEIYKISKALHEDSRFVKSMNKYTGAELRYFSDTYEGGGSMGTIAYKSTVEYLKNDMNMKPVKKNENRQLNSNSSEIKSKKTLTSAEKKRLKLMGYIILATILFSSCMNFIAK